MRYVTTLFRNPQGFLSRKFDPAWVDKLARNLRRWDEAADLVVLTHFEREDFTEPVEVIPLMHPERDWSTKMERYRPEAGGDRAIIIDLDTVAARPLAPLWERWDHDAHPFLAPPGILETGIWNSSVVAVSGARASEVWQRFSDGRDADMRNHHNTLFVKFCDTVWMHRNLEEQPELFDGVLSPVARNYLGSWDPDVWIWCFDGPRKQTHYASHALIQQEWV